MNILFLTLGTSDIQFDHNPSNGFEINGKNELIKEGLPAIKLRKNRNYPTYLLLSPRHDGKIIRDNYEAFESIVQAPLVLPFIRRLVEQKIAISEIWMVFTDQADKRFQFGDTLYVKEIVRKKIEALLPDSHFVDYKVSEEVRNIDFQYEKFRERTRELAQRKHTINKVYLLPQGGIDQINHALTLQLIQLFKDKVQLFQQAEQAAPEQLHFPRLFLNDLTAQLVAKHIRDFDFGKATDLILDDDQLRELAHYAALRLNLRHEDIDDNKVDNLYRIGWDRLGIFDKQRLKLADLTYRFKILMKQKNYNEALSKLFSITENMFKLRISEYAGEDVFNYYDRNCDSSESVNDKWLNFIETKMGQGYVEQLKKKGVYLNNPNVIAIFYIFRWLVADQKLKIDVKDKEIKKMHNVINDWRNKRNEITHRLGSVSEDEINKVLEQRKITLDGFYGLLDKINGTSGFGIFKPIQKQILAHYHETL